MQNLLFSINTVAPVFIIVFLGIFLRWKKIVDENFAKMASGLSFKIALPVMLFDDISKTDFRSVFDLGMIFFAVAGIFLVYAVSSAVTPFFVREPRSRGSLIQGVFRGNYAILGLPLAYNALGQAGLTKGAALMVFAVPLYNILAVITLTVHASDGQRKGRSGDILRSVITNPYILSIVLALPFSYFKIQLPAVAEKTIDYLSSMAIPLALLSMGCSFSFSAARKNLTLSLTAALLKIGVIPVIMTTAAYLLGFRGVELGILYILFASPTAVTSFVMAQAMNCDADLAANIIVITTMGAVVTLTAGIYALRAFGLI